MPESAVSSSDTPAAAVVAAPPDAIELPAPPGWRKQFIPKKSTTSSPRRGRVVFISPDGEEIKNKTHLAQYLKAHHGHRSSDFDWDTGESPTRRSLRIMEKASASRASHSLRIMENASPSMVSRSLRINASPSKVSHSLRITENASPRKARRYKAPAKHSRKVKATKMPEDEPPAKRSKKSHSDESEKLEMMGFSDEEMVSTEDTGSKEGSPLQDTNEKGDARAQEEGTSLPEDAKDVPLEGDGVEQKAEELKNVAISGFVTEPENRLAEDAKREGIGIEVLLSLAGNEAEQKSPEVQKHKVEELKSPGTNIVIGVENNKNEVNEDFNKTEENMKNKPEASKRYSSENSGSSQQSP